jgi:hypothetical protein
MSTAARYTMDRLDVPGMKFKVDIEEPKERIQAYLDDYKHVKPDDKPFEVGERFDFRGQG